MRIFFAIIFYMSLLSFSFGQFNGLSWKKNYGGSQFDFLGNTIEGEISEDQMEKILKDINNEEKKLMEQMMKDSLKTKKKGTKKYKDW